MVITVSTTPTEGIELVADDAMAMINAVITPVPR
jgi:hypothetical protein